MTNRKISTDAIQAGSITESLLHADLSSKITTANTKAGDAYAQANSAYGQANTAYGAANSAANTVRVSQNSGSTLSAKQLNFVNTANVTITVTDSGDGNANVAIFSSGSGGSGTLSNIAISSNTVFATNANAFNFINTSTVSVSVSQGVDGNANISFTTQSGANSVSSVFTADGVGNTYTMGAFAANANNIIVTIDGVILTPGTEYSTSGTTLTILYVPANGSKVETRTITGGGDGGTASLGFVRSSFVGDGSNVNFTLSSTPVDEDNCLVFVDRVLQRNSEYNVSTSTLQFVSAPDNGAVIDAFVSQYLASNAAVLKAGDTMTGNLNVSATLITQNVIPDANVTYDLGSPTKRFKDLYLSGNTILLGGATLTANGINLVTAGNIHSGNIITDAAYGSNHNGDPIIIIRNSAAANALTFNPNEGDNYTHLYSNGLVAFSGNIATDGIRGSNHNGDPIIIIRNSAQGNALTINADSSGNNTIFHANGVVLFSNSVNAANFITSSGLNIANHANNAYGQANSAYGQANSAYGQANSAYGAANNTVLKAGDTMTGQLNISAGGLLVTGNVGIGTTSPGYKLDVNGIVNIAQGSYIRKAFADNTEEYLIRGDATAWNGFISYTPSGGTSNRGFKFGAWDNNGAINNWVTFWDGNVGIGTTSPATKLAVNGGIQILAGNAIYFQNALADVNATISATGGSGNSTMSFNAGAMVLNGSGNVGIGTTSPGKPLQVNGIEISISSVGSQAGYTQGAFLSSSGTDSSPGARGQGMFLFNEGNDTTWYMGTNYVYADTFSINRKASTTSIDTATAQLTHALLTITSGGNVGIGTTSPASTLAVDGGTGMLSSGVIARFFGTSGNSLIVRGNGNCENTNGSFGVISDKRLKQDIVDAPSQWNDLKNVRFRKYRLKSEVGVNENAPSMLGVVAQELEVVCPGLVEDHTDDNGETIKSVKSSILLMKAAVALQEAMVRIEKLEAEVAAMLESGS